MQDFYRSWGFQQVVFPRFGDHRHIKLVRLSALRTGCLYPPGNITGTFFCYRFQSPRRSAAARLLRLWVRIPPGAWMSVVSVMCCQVEVSATNWSLVQRSLTDCGVSLCVI